MSRKANPPAQTDAASILSLAVIGGLQTAEQVHLYVATEDRVRCGFLQQGKILQCLGAQGTELLKAAGIKPTSRTNALNAQWVLDTFTRLTPVVLIHNGAEAVPFDESIYDTLTLRQCDLLRKAFSGMGVVAHRPDIAQSRQIVQEPNWDDNLETWFEHGTTLAGLAERETEKAAALEADRQRVADLERQIEENRLRMESLRATDSPAAAPSPPPVIAFNQPPPAAAATDVAATVDEEDAEYEPEEQEEQEEEEIDAEAGSGEEESSDPAPEPTSITTDPETAGAPPTGALSPEEVGQAVSDATEGIVTMALWEAAFEHLEALTTDLLAHADTAEISEMTTRLEHLLQPLLERAKPASTPAAAAAPAKPARKGKNRVAA